jgi:hypothetical protein
MPFELNDNTDDVLKKLRALHGVPWSKILSDGFFEKATKFHSLQDLIETSGCQPGDAAFDEFLKAETSFTNWENLKEMAASEYAGDHS